MAANESEFMNTSFILTNTSHQGEIAENGDFRGIYQPTKFSSTAIVLLVILYSVAIILSFAGNLTVIVVFFVGKRSKRDVNSFLINLAFADLLMACFCMPYTFTETMLAHWIFGKVMCPAVHFMQILSVSVSIGTNVVVGIDRYERFFIRPVIEI